MSILYVWVVKSANAMNCLFRFRVCLCNEKTLYSAVLRERGILLSFPSHRKLKASLLKRINSFLFFWKKCHNKLWKVAHFIMFKGALWEKILVLRFVERSEKRKLFNSLWPSTNTAYSTTNNNFLIVVLAKKLLAYWHSCMKLADLPNGL